MVNKVDLNAKNFGLDLISGQIEMLVKLLPELIYVIDLEQRQLVYISNRITDVLGYTADDIQAMGYNFGPIMIHDDMTTFSTNISKKFSRMGIGETTEFMMNFRHKNAQVRTLRNKATVLKQDDTGKNRYIMLIAEDITEQVEREENFQFKQQAQMLQLQRQHTQMEEAEAIFKFGSWECDLKERHFRWSEGLFDMIGIESKLYPSSIVPLDLYQKYVHPDDLEQLQIYTRKVLSQKNKIYENEHRLIDEDGKIKYVMLRARVHYDEEGKMTRAMGVTADLTEIENYRRELERQVVALNKSNKELEQFAYVASHDLQEPLRKIKAFGERLDKKYTGLLDDEGKFFIDRMINAAQRMNQLIEDLLTYSRASRYIDAPQSVDLNVVVKNVLEDLELKIQDEKAIVQLDTLPIIEAQRVQMRQLFQNLIENALKFRKPDVAPNIQIRCKKIPKEEFINLTKHKTENDYYEFKVIDNGIGFEQQYADQIFAIFQRLHGRNEYEGTGLGLAICRKIVETHNGYMEARGQEGIGAEFVFYLPV